jgi:hypothetical protein
VTIPAAAWANLALAWVLTILVEGAVLWVALAPRHSARTRLLAAVWLSSCTLPLVHFVFPALRAWGFSDVGWVAAAEVFAPVAECVLFSLVLAPGLGGGGMRGRDWGAIVVANVVSFGVGVGVVG